MTPSNFETALRNAYEKREQKVPKHRPQRTDECPNLTRFAEALDHGWSPAERLHVSDCEYCQRIMLFEWRLHPPGVWGLVEYLAGVLPDRKSMQMYLEEEPAYARLQKSVIVKALAQVVREIKGFSHPDADSGLAADLAAFFAFGLSDVAVYTRGSAQFDMAEEDAEDAAVQRVRNYADSISVMSVLNEGDERPHELTVSLPDDRITLEIVSEGEQLTINAASVAIENAGRRLLVDVLPDSGAPVAVEILMQEDRSSERSVGTAVAHITGGKGPREFEVMAAWTS